jgi:23S rRNA pseudouridine2605 synthase
MRINQFIAQATGMSRRAADDAVAEGLVTVNDQIAILGMRVAPQDKVTLKGKTLELILDKTTIMLHKPVDYVCSRNGQGSKTIYDLLPTELHNLKPVGRLDKDSSGILLMTNDGALAHELTHPSKQKEKIYEIELNKNLHANDQAIIEKGVELKDGPSKLSLEGSGNRWTITMSEGRNRQIRRTFEALGYNVIKLHRTKFGPYILDQLQPSHYQTV